jgi:hypothetical protein
MGLNALVAHFGVRSKTVVTATNRAVAMDEDEEMAELKAQEARRVRDEAKKCLRHASFQLGKAAYEIDEFLKDFNTARIPIRRQVILNEAIAHLVANVLPNLGIAEMARVQVQLALRDFSKSAF